MRKEQLDELEDVATTFLQLGAHLSTSPLSDSEHERYSEARAKFVILFKMLLDEAQRKNERRS